RTVETEVTRIGLIQIDRLRMRTGRLKARTFGNRNRALMKTDRLETRRTAEIETIITTEEIGGIEIIITTITMGNIITDPITKIKI
ncbi:hypothetical protein, partial [Streptococcus anginosus]|uniref:hypothetical protein n=1 Tax=Streptococcus anginosus TaxID=1328 RepID=UPI002ED775F2